MLPPLTRLPRAPTTSNIDATSTTSTTSSNNTSFTIATTSTVFNRTAQPLVDLGAHFAASPHVVVARSDVVFSIVGYPSDVRSVLLHPTSGALADLRPGGVLVHMTTSKTSLFILSLLFLFIFIIMIIIIIIILVYFIILIVNNFFIIVVDLLLWVKYVFCP